MFFNKSHSNKLATPFEDNKEKNTYFIDVTYFREKVERLTDYYFWMLEDFRTKLPFVCESRQKSIGCIVGNGETYKGFANR